MPQNKSDKTARLREYKRKWAAADRLKNPERYRANQKRSNDNNRERLRARDRARYVLNRDKVRKKSLSYYYRNRARLREANRVYCKATWETRKALKRQSMAKARLNKTNGYFATLLRTSLLKALQGKVKTCSALRLLGCSIDQFRVHLQSKFRDGMAWNNHGTIWHIDHIKPCASFNLTNHNEQANCFHYSNMQPLLVLENLRKGDRCQTV